MPPLALDAKAPPHRQQNGSGQPPSGATSARDSGATRASAASGQKKANAPKHRKAGRTRQVPRGGQAKQTSQNDDASQPHGQKSRDAASRASHAGSGGKRAAGSAATL
ncbi:MAG TPA: hypothetical protein VFX03_00700, partial [Thermomicrobiales bacterium]|nr:hypothetical protein [Thermomicrobiales bacterium]